MKLRPRILRLAWILVPVAACAFLVWNHAVRARHAGYVTGLGGDEVRTDATSPTGYVGGVRRFVIPEPNEPSLDWIEQTQTMLARHAWRVRHVDYENAPLGHETDAAAPFRWWLAAVAWIGREATGRPLGLAVEQAALWEGTLLQLLLVAVATIIAARRLGLAAAACVAVGLVTLFPLADAFLPGLPASEELALVLGIGSLLVLIAGAAALETPPSPSAPPRRPSAAFCAAGILGGLCLWVSVALGVMLLVGVGVGALIAARLTRPAAGAEPPRAWAGSWRAWSLAGGLMVFVAYWVEYFPDHLGAWQLRAVHPLYGIAWIGGGLGLARLVARLRRERDRWTLGDALVGLLALAALAAIPVLLWKRHDLAFLAPDLAAYRLTRLTDGVSAANLPAWLFRDGASAAFLATLAPVALLLLAGWLLLRPGFAAAHRAAVALALGPALALAVFAGFQLRWWSAFDAVAVVLFATVTAALAATAGHRTLRWIAAAVGLIVCVAGVSRLAWPTTSTIDEKETMALVHRDLAHWLAKRASPGGVIVLAPPTETAALCYYGSLRGLATLNPENHAALGAAVRILSATTAEEAWELARQRRLAYVVIPSWDTYLDEYARAGLGQLEGSFLDRLHHWDLPAWLRPVPYQVPNTKVTEGQSAIVLEVVDPQGDAIRASRETEYFLQMGWLDLATAKAETLRRFPADLGALVARAQVDLARQDEPGFKQEIDALTSRLAHHGDRYLAWDRRVSFAYVLARAKQMDAARTQARQCFAQLDAVRLRSLPTESLYRLMILGRAFNLQIADPKLQALASELLPADLRARVTSTTPSS